MTLRTRGATVRSLALLAVVAFVALGTVTALPVGAAVPPPPPAAYYGGLTVDGDPAPAGTTVTATIGGEIRGQLTTDVAGRYGEAGGFGSKLVVHGTDADTGSEVKFRVGNRIVGSATWTPGDVRELDLRTSAVNVGGANPNTGSSDTGIDPVTSVPPVAEPTVTFARTADGVSLSVTGAQANRSVTLGTDSIGDGDITLDRLGLTPTRDGDFDIDVTYTNAPSETPSFDVSAGGVTLGYFIVEHSIPDGDIAEVTFDFRVSQQRLQTAGLSPSDVVLGRYHNGTWTPLETTLVETAGGYHRFRVVSPGLSVFAIGSKAPTVSTVTSAPTQTATGTAVMTSTATTTATQTETASATQTPTATVTETRGPGFGVTTVFVSLFVLSAIALFRRE